MNNGSRFNVPSYMGQQPQRFSSQGHGGGCRVGHFSATPSNSQHAYSSVPSTGGNQTQSSPSTDGNEPECKSNPSMVFSTAAATAATGAMAGAKSGTFLGIVGGFFGGAAIGGAGAMTRDSLQVQECLDSKGPKP